MTRKMWKDLHATRRMPGELLYPSSGNVIGNRPVKLDAEGCAVSCAIDDPEAIGYAMHSQPHHRMGVVVRMFGLDSTARARCAAKEAKRCAADTEPDFERSPLPGVTVGSLGARRLFA